jgi:hypothetical protein
VQAVALQPKEAVRRFNTKNQLRAGEGADSTSACALVDFSPLLPLSVGVHAAAAVAAEAKAATATAAAATSLLVATALAVYTARYAQAHGTTEATGVVCEREPFRATGVWKQR